jgi:transketolase
MTNEKLGPLSIHTIRTPSIDAAPQAKPGHPGTPMALARRSRRSGTAPAVH